MIEIILDASQIETFEACPRKWYNDHVLNLTTPSTNPALSTGSWFHEVLRIYYEAGLESPPISKHIRKAVDYAASLTTGEASGRWPRVRKDPKFHMDRLRAYLVTHMNEDDAAEILFVEKGFSTLFYEDIERRYILEGTIDLGTVEKSMGFTITDHKTQIRAYEKYPNNHQCFNYLAFTGANYFRYNFIGQQETQNENTFRRPIFRPQPGQLEQWKRDVKRTFQEMERYVRAGLSDVLNYPKRLTQCQTKFGLCQFHKLCEIPDDSKWRPVILKSYKEKEAWKPWS